MSLRRPVALFTVLLAAGLALSGCGQPVSETPELAVSDSVSAEGVLLAAVLLATADIEAAVAEGLVTPDEVDEARRAVEDGTLDEWRELAEETQSR